jgi:DNA-binding CsgD family transcriptional regulator
MCDMFYDGNLTAAESLGRFSAKRDMFVICRRMMQFMSPSLIVQLMNVYWRQDESCGLWRTGLVGRDLVATLSGWGVADSVLCRRILGYIHRTLELCGAVLCSESSKCDECCALGDRSYVFRFRWQHEGEPALVDFANELSRLPELDSLVRSIVEIVLVRLSFPYVEIWVQSGSAGELAAYQSFGVKRSGVIHSYFLQVGNNRMGRLDVEAHEDSQLDVLGEMIPWLAQMLHDALFSSERATALRTFHLRLRLAQRAWELTPRETDVLELLLRGLTNDAIARKLGLSISTIEQYVTRILDKSDTRKRSALCWVFWIEL